jgi:putative polyhydroxyalkanoate system protein
MAVIKLRRKHELGADRARSTVEGIAKKLKQELDADYRWKGSTLEFRRTGASGHIDVQDRELAIEIKLGMLLSPLKGKIEKSITDEIDKHLKA